MILSFSIDNQTVRAADVLSTLLERCRACPVDIASAYFSISGYKLLKDGLHHAGALRLLLGSEPAGGEDVGLRAAAGLAAELAGMPFSEETLRLVEDLIAFLRAEKVQVRLFQDGFLHAKAYLFHQDRVGAGNYEDRLRPFAAIVGSSNFTGPGLSTNRELNLVHRVFTEEDEATDAEAARRADYLRPADAPQNHPRPQRRGRAADGAAVDQERGGRAGGDGTGAMVLPQLASVRRLQVAAHRPAEPEQVRPVRVHALPDLPQGALRVPARATGRQ